MPEHPIEASRRREWQRMRARGLPRQLVVRGVLLRGIPMAVAVVLLLELLREGDGGLGARLRDPAFLVRFVVATALFSLGGIVSSYARWRALERRFGDGEQAR
jgi:hypothetical protein